MLQLADVLSKFQVNIITGFGVMSIFDYKGFARNPEFENIPVYSLGRVRDTKLSTNTSIDKLLKFCKMPSSYHLLTGLTIFELLREKQQGVK